LPGIAFPAARTILPGLFATMIRLRSRPALLLAFAALAVTGAPAAPAGPAAADTAPAADQAPRYPFRGVILGIFPDKGSLLVKHEDIPGLMKGMKMAFRVTDPAVLSQLKEGETITATLIAREDDFWLENVTPVVTKKK
jgi:Cu/Ag efflux protein CusF